MTNSVQPPSDEMMWLSRGTRAVRAGDRDQATRCFRAAHDADPQNTTALLWLAWLAPTREESLALLCQVLDLDPGNERARAGIRWARQRPSIADLSPQVVEDISTERVPPARRLPRLFLALAAFLAVLVTATVGLWLGLSLRYAPAKQLASLLVTPTTTATSSPTVTPMPSSTATATLTPTSTPNPTATNPPDPASSRDQIPDDSLAGPLTPSPDPLDTGGPTPVMPIPSPAPTTESAIINGEKWIAVDLTNQELTAFQGGTPVFETLVSTGLSNTPTVVGEFRIYWKLKNTLMTGPGYYLPDVPYTMYFYRDYALHGAYWHNNFGQPMSHGCINLKDEDARWLFEWANPSLPEGSNQVQASQENPGTLVVTYY